MAFWKTHPSLRLFVPEPVRVGQELSVRLEIDAAEPVPVEWVDLTLETMEGWTVGAGKNRVARSHRYPKQVARLIGEGELSGTTQHHAIFVIAAGQPPSRDASIAYVRYSLHAQASIPWWPDARASWALRVRAPDADAQPVPAVITEGASQLLSVSLESQRVALGGVVGGVVALRQAVDRPVVVDVTLRSVLHLVSWNGFERARNGPGFTTSIQLTSATGPVPFRFTFPDATPSFAAATFRERWELVVSPRTEGFWGSLTGGIAGGAVHIPMEVVESSGLARLSERLVAPSVGEARARELLAEGARLRPAWTVDGLGLERTEESTFGSIDARIEWVAGEEGTFLRASIEPPRLGLGLRVSRASMLDQLVGGLGVGVPSWDGKHKVSGRAPSQLAPFLTPVALVAADLDMIAHDELIELTRKDDEVHVTTLTRFVDEIEGVLAELAAALAAIPPPAGTSIDRTEAARLARLLRGTFHPGDLALRGTLDERPFEAALVFEGDRAVALAVSVSGVSSGVLHIGPGRDAASLASVPSEARALVAALAPGITVSIEGGRARAMIPAPTGTLFGVDHERSVAVGQTLVALARSLSPDRGPFR